MNSNDAENLRALQARLRDTRQWTPERTFDVLRNRLNALAQNIARMHAQIGGPGAEGNPLPSWDDLATFQRQVVQQLSSIAELMRGQSHYLTTDHVYASAQFPAEKEPMLNMLLAKRLAPDLDSWYDRSLSLGEKTEAGLDGTAAGQDSVDWKKLWNWAGPAANQIAAEVLTGQDDDGDEDESGEDDDVEDDEAASGAPTAAKPIAQPPIQAQPQLTLEQLLRFANTGEANP